MGAVAGPLAAAACSGPRRPPPGPGGGAAPPGAGGVSGGERAARPQVPSEPVPDDRPRDPGAGRADLRPGADRGTHRGLPAGWVGSVGGWVIMSCVCVCVHVCGRASTDETQITTTITTTAPQPHSGQAGDVAHDAEAGRGGRAGHRVPEPAGAQPAVGVQGEGHGRVEGEGREGVNRELRVGVWGEVDAEPQARWWVGDRDGAHGPAPTTSVDAQATRTKRSNRTGAQSSNPGEL